MIRTLDLSTFDWTVAGWPPHGWRFMRAMETGAQSLAEIAAVPAKAPGSVQQALLDAGIIPDWNIGANAREVEWIENRQWIYRTRIPAEAIVDARDVRLRCDGLDYSGWILIDGVEIASFKGTFVPHVFDLTSYVQPGRDIDLEIVFDTPPRWLGQFGYSSQIKDWKPRFNYTWDWTSRLVQTGIWEGIYLELRDGACLGGLSVRAGVDPISVSGIVRVSGSVEDADGLSVNLRIEDGAGKVISSKKVSVAGFADGITLTAPGVRLWQPNGRGEQPLYTVTAELIETNGAVADRQSRRVGFRHIEWLPNSGAADECDPWICSVNGVPVFLQGVNWTPIRPNFADVPDDEYRKLVALYKELGVNILRIWGGAYLEKTILYDLCDEAGIMLWQEFPLAASGVENLPPDDSESIDEMEAIVRSYVARRAHHASLIIWCGGNEMQTALDGVSAGNGLPTSLAHPMLARMAEVLAEVDPGRRFTPVSASGPRFMADQADYGKGLHWDVHGPWTLGAMTMDEWTEYWRSDDALFRSETGAPGASSADLIRRYLGNYEATPGALDNELWRRTSWWIEWPIFVDEHGREPNDLEEYVAWSQDRQAKALQIAVDSEKRRFPAVGGVIIWMGHDSFPCATNTSIVDFWGHPKPAALALAEVWKNDYDSPKHAES